MAIKSAPMPFVDWKALVQASDPLKAATRARYRTLVGRGITHGVTTSVHETHLLSGKRTFHSVLTLLAIKADQAGDTDGQRFLSDAASRFERTYGDRLAAWLASEPAKTLPEADWFAEAARDTWRSLDQWTRLRDVVFASGFLASTDAESAHVDVTTTRSGEHIELLLPRELVDQSGVREGDPVWVFRRMIGHAAVIDLLAAVNLEVAPSGDEETDEEEAARRYIAGPGALPSKTELEKLIDIASTRPRRKIRVAG